MAFFRILKKVHRNFYMKIAGSLNHLIQNRRIIIKCKLDIFSCVDWASGITDGAEGRIAPLASLGCLFAFLGVFSSDLGFWYSHRHPDSLAFLTFYISVG